jgi:hypothetical protein
LLGGGALVAIALACTDIVGPTGAGSYEWRLCTAGGIPGDCPTLDSLSFHWPRSSLPVRIWVEASAGLPDDFRYGVALWKNALIYGEYQAEVVGDSTSADVIVRFEPAPSPAPPPSARIREAAQGLDCSGATDLVLNDPDRTKILLPMRIYIFTGLDPTLPAVARCLRVVSSHELGHTMGLFQHSPNAGDLMYAQPTLNGISARDVRTVRFIYHFQADLTPARGP